MSRGNTAVMDRALASMTNRPAVRVSALSAQPTTGRIQSAVSARRAARRTNATHGTRGWARGERMGAAARQPRDTPSGADGSPSPVRGRATQRDSKPLGHVSADAYWKDGKLHVVDPGEYQRRLATLLLGDGECVEIRITRATEAKKHHQLKWYWGYIVKQCSEATGYSVPEIDAMFRALLLPHDVTTISEMSEDQMREFNRACEDHAASVIGVVVTGPDEIRKKAA